MTGSHEVRGSIPLGSTKLFTWLKQTEEFDAVRLWTNCDNAPRRSRRNSHRNERPEIVRFPAIFVNNLSSRRKTNASFASCFGGTFAPSDMGLSAILKLPDRLVPGSRMPVLAFCRGE
jgi:hypothetical protein